jgi:6-phosphogluconolactonase (cycloisomerase 2 family)
MRKSVRLLSGVAIAAGLAIAAPAVAGATTGSANQASSGPPHAVFVQTDGAAGNQVVAYDRQPDGALTWSGTNDTGGLGGQLSGSQVDFLASQGSLAYVQNARLLLALNAGSNSVSVFSVRGADLSLLEVVPSGGEFPNSIAVDGNLVYVLNARDGGSLTGFQLSGSELLAIPGSARALGLTTPTDSTEFTHTPGQVAFSPSGDQLLVTTKATTSAIDVYGVHRDGTLSAAPTVNTEAGAVPFALTFDRWGDVVVANAGTNSVTTYHLDPSGVLTAIATATTGQAATCWVSTSRDDLYASNAGSGSVSTIADRRGSLGRTTTTGTVPGTVDSATTPDGRFLYVQGGKNGSLDAFSVGPTGSLAQIGALVVPNAIGGEGLVAL